MLENWLYKLAGTAVLLLASLLYGRCKVMEERKKVHEFEALLDLVNCITDGIEYGMKPLPEIFAEYRNEILEKNGFLEMARKSGLRETWMAYERKFSVSGGNGMKQFAGFCMKIGNGYKKEELELCGITRKRMEEELEKRKKDNGNREKLYRTIPPLMAMSLVLMLL